MIDALVYDPSSYAVQDDPYPLYERMRDEAPVYRNEAAGFWALTRFDDVLRALGDAETFSSAEGTQLESGGPGWEFMRQMMLNLDEPDHGRLRRLVSRAFTPRRVEALEPSIRALCRTFLDALGAAGGGCAVEDYAARLPMAVISTLVGIEPEDQDEVRRLADRINHREPGSIFPGEDANAAGIDLYIRFVELVRARRAEPRDDMASALVAASVTEDGVDHQLTDTQIVMFCVLLALGGYETTTKLIGNLAVFLTRYPEQRELLLGDPGLVGGAVEEALRFDSPSQYQGRVTTRDVTVHGVTIPAGERVLLVNGSGNRDPREFPDADVYDVRRSAPRHLAFGQGIHYCIGANLARLEARVAVEELLAAFPRHTVDLDRLERRWSSNFRGLSAAPLSVS